MAQHGPISERERPSAVASPVCLCGSDSGSDPDLQSVGTGEIPGGLQPPLSQTALWEEGCSCDTPLSRLFKDPSPSPRPWTNTPPTRPQLHSNTNFTFHLTLVFVLLGFTSMSELCLMNHS